MVGKGRVIYGPLEGVESMTSFLPAGPRQWSDSFPGPGSSAWGSARGRGPGTGGSLQLSARNSQACRQRSQGGPRTAHGTGHRQGNRLPQCLLTLCLSCSVKLLCSVGSCRTYLCKPTYRGQLKVPSCLCPICVLMACIQTKSTGSRFGCLSSTTVFNIFLLMFPLSGR